MRAIVLKWLRTILTGTETLPAEKGELKKVVMTFMAHTVTYSSSTVSACSWSWVAVCTWSTKNIKNTSKRNLYKLQCMQHCLARVVLNVPHFPPSISQLQQLHWFPVIYQIKFIHFYMLCCFNTSAALFGHITLKTSETSTKILKHLF